MPRARALARRLGAALRRLRARLPGVRRERLEAVVAGRVQGVGFRAFVRREARALGLAGWVRNEPDGRVRLAAEGPPADLDRLATRLRVGPRNAAVDDVDAKRGPAEGGFEGFEIRR